MNIALRKLAMIEKTYAEMEENARIQGYSECPYDRDFQRKISAIMDKVRLI